MYACETQKNPEREGQQLLVSRSAQEALAGAGFCCFQHLVSSLFVWNKFGTCLEQVCLFVCLFFEK